MKNKERLIWPDNIKCMLVFMVVLWHLPYNIPGINMLFAPFFMPAFFWLSGYFQKNTLQAVLKRVKTLLVPFLLIGILKSFLYSRYVLNVYAETSFLDNIKSLLINISGRNDMLWFIPCLFVAQLVVFFTLKFFQDTRIQLLVSSALLVGGANYKPLSVAY